MWLPCSVLARLIWTVPISWLPIRTLIRFVWAPLLPSRRRGWGSPGPRWQLPSGWVPILIFIFQSCLLIGFVPGFQLREWPSTVNSEGILTNGHKNGKVPRVICGSYPEISVLELHDSSGLMKFVVLRCNHRIVKIFRIWIALPSRLPQQDFNAFGIRAVLILSLLVTLCSLTRFAPEFSHDSGSVWFSPWENRHEATIEFACWAKLRRMSIGRKIKMKSAFTWATRHDLALHLSQHNSTWGVVQVLVLLP